MPMVNIISGGLHARRQLDFQDFLVIPSRARSYSEALEMCVAVHAATAAVLAAAGYSTLKADEGGFGPAVSSHREALALLQQGIEAAGMKPGGEIAFALDVAATHFFDESAGVYRLASEGRDCDAEEIVAMVADLASEFPIVSVEDALAEDDWDGWVTFTRRLGHRLQIVGDDLFTTNLERLERGIERGAANAVLVKMNQIGTISETLGGRRPGPRGRVPDGDLGAFGRDGGSGAGGSGGRHVRAVRSRWGRSLNRSGWPSTTSCCGSSGSSATLRCLPGREPWAARQRPRRPGERAEGPHHRLHLGLDRP